MGIFIIQLRMEYLFFRFLHVYVHASPNVRKWLKTSLDSHKSTFLCDIKKSLPKYRRYYDISEHTHNSNAQIELAFCCVDHIRYYSLEKMGEDMENF